MRLYAGIFILFIMLISGAITMYVQYVKAVFDNTKGPGSILTAAEWNELPTELGAPSGAVMYFNLANCPLGWSSIPSAEGRYIVGLNSSGSLGGTAGTNLTDLENRSVGQHNHTGSTNTTGSHAHNLNIAYNYSGAIFAMQGGGTAGLMRVSAPAGNHSHTLTVNDAGTVAGTNAPYIQFLVCQKN